MADEITVTVQVTCSSSNYTPGTVSITNQIDQSVVGGAQNVQTINTSISEAITKADATAGIVVLRNLDGTNYMNWGTSTGLVCKLKAGEVALTRLSTGATLWAQANTAAVKLYTWFLNG